MRKIWDGKALRELIHESGLTSEDIANEMGIKLSTLRSYEKGMSAPNFTCLCRFAEFFGVTLDEIAGLTKRGDTTEYFKGEHKQIVEALERKYKRKLDKLGIQEDEETRGESDFYPHNLLSDIFEEEYSKEIPYDSEGLEHAVSLLKKKELDMVNKRYKEGMTLQEIGADYNVTRERVRQVVAKALRKLRHPMMKACIMHGKGYVETAEGQRDIEEKLNAKSKFLEGKEARLKKEEEKLEKLEKTIQEKSKKIGGGDISSIAKLHMSDRANKWLKRGIRINGELVEISTIGDLETVASKGKLLNIRNIGVKTAEEICDALFWETGNDYRAVNGLVKKGA